MKRKVITVLSAFLIQVCLGGIYAFSAFVPELILSGFSMAQTQLVFGLNTALVPLWSIAGGMLMAKIRPAAASFLGGLLFGTGYLLSSAGSFLYTAAGIGLVSGAGAGITYLCPLAASVRAFPQKKGLITGVIVAGFGGGAMFLSVLAQFLSQRGFSVFEIFRFTGIFYICIICFFSLFLNQGSDSKITDSSEKCRIKNIWKRKDFRLLFTGMFCGTFSGLIIIGNLKAIGILSGVTVTAANLGITFLSVGNLTGRVIWGIISDRYQSRAMPVSLFLISVCSFIFSFLKTGYVTFLILCILTGFCYGSSFVLYPAAVARIFGSGYVGKIYPFVFCSMFISGIIGPPLAGEIYDLTASFRYPLWMCAFISFTGALVIWYFDRKSCISCEALEICELKNGK